MTVSKCVKCAGVCVLGWRKNPLSYIMRGCVQGYKHCSTSHFQEVYSKRKLTKYNFEICFIVIADKGRHKHSGKWD